MEEEKLRLDSEKGALQRDKASLQTKLKQAIEHSQCFIVCVTCVTPPIKLASSEYLKQLTLSVICHVGY